MSMTLRELCLARTPLTAPDIALLETYEATLGAVADLIRGDAFIDCMDGTGCAFVAAQASPRYADSTYQAQILGMAALFADEPAVYRAFNEGMPFHDIMANTQENKTVRQDVTPIKNAGGNVIGVLIIEQDVSRVARMEDKLQALAGDWQQSPLPAEDACPSGDCLRIREAHHRIKNNLQLIASVCSIKSRSVASAETRAQLETCAGMVMSVAKLHDMLSETYKDEQSLPLGPFLQRLTESIAELVRPGRTVDFTLSCDEMEIGGNMATAIALVVSELIFNAIEHAFGPDGGHICIEARRGSRFGTVLVADNGTGFASGTPKGVGLRIASAMVRDKLNGEFTMMSDPNGTKAVFTFACTPALTV